MCLCNAILQLLEPSMPMYLLAQDSLFRELIAEMGSNPRLFSCPPINFPLPSPYLTGEIPPSPSLSGGGVQGHVCR